MSLPSVATSPGATKGIIRPPHAHIAQMVGYLSITGLEVALLVNFKEAKLTWKRVVSGLPEEKNGWRG